ncbi:MAG: hypothetical protein RJB13_220 [Pseudomonadota bacterium]
MLKLFWNADSPYCRIVLWHIATSQQYTEVELEHLSWEDIRATATGGRLGRNATVPCLQLGDGTIITDSLRILAYFLNDGFDSWFLSEDGEFYRHIEGQLSRVMYGLYDRPTPEALKKVEARWNLVLKSADGHMSTKAASRPAVPELPALALQTLHIFVQFCLHFQPDWSCSLPASLERALHELEREKDFKWYKEQLSQQNTTVSFERDASPREAQGFSN